MNLLSRALLMMVLILVTACHSGDSDAAARHGTGPGAASAAFDCSAIQGPLSTNDFYEDNPTYIDKVDDSASWTTSTPAAQNMDVALLEKASKKMAAMPHTWSLLVVRHGALVFERYYNGSAKNQSNNVHSASKSIWGAAVGIAINQGLISSANATIASILPARYVAKMSARTKTIRVRDLITMTSGISWDEDATSDEIEESPNWIEAILARGTSSTPGTHFNYSTGDTHLLSAVLAAATKTTGCEFIHKNLLAPMGIVAEHWGRDPQGYFSGGYNLYLTARELAKFGLLYLHDGNWNGVQLVPAAWVQASMTDQVDGHGYGYTFWLQEIAGHDVAMAWGYAGQMVYIIKDLDLVVVMTTNTRDFDDTGFHGESIIENFVIPAAH